MLLKERKFAKKLMMAAMVFTMMLGCGAVLEGQAKLTVVTEPEYHEGERDILDKDDVDEDTAEEVFIEDLFRPGSLDGVMTGRRSLHVFPFQPNLLSCDRVVEIAREVASRHRLETGLVIGVMRVESGFIANAISPATAVGLMQVLPSSGERIGCKDLFDPIENADCGARILAAFLRYYKGNLMLALSGYNAGHAWPDRAKKERRVPLNFKYVEDVLRARARWLRDGCKAFE